MRYLILFISLLYSGLVLGQQSIPSLYGENNPIYGDKKYVHRNEMWLCTSVSFPVDISYDAFHVYFSPEIGTFRQVVPGKPSEVIKDNVEGIFNATGRSAGVYEFVFTSANDDFCGMSAGMESVVRIYLVPDLRPFTVLSNLCGGETDNVNLLNYLPFEVKNFADSMGWKINFYDINQGKNSLITDPTNIQVSLKDVGTRKYSYRYDDTQGPLKGGLDSMKKVPIYCCVDSAIASINVKIHGEEIKIEDRKVSFCMESLASVPHNVPLMHLNLMSFLGVQAKGGKWELNTDVSVSALVKLDDEQNGLVSIKLELAKDLVEQGVISSLKLDCKYKYEDCSGVEHTATLLIEITDKLTNIVTDDTKTVCRNLTSGSIDLDTYFQFYVPTTSGAWFYINNGDEIYMPTSTVYLDTLKAGSLYNFTYKVYSVVEDLCDLQNKEANFSLRIRDINTGAGGAANMCKSTYKDPTNNKVNLYSYIPGFTPDKVDYTKISWYSCDSYGECDLAINSSDAEAYNPMDANYKEVDFNVRPFKYVYESECGKVEGKVYLSIVDSLQKENYERSIVICYTDDWADNVNMNNVSGVAGLLGDWELAPESPTGLPTDDTIWKSPVFNAKKAYEYVAATDTPDANDQYIFIFKYTPKPQECLTQPITIKVVVTKTVE